MSRMAGVGQAEEEACRVGEVEVHGGTNAAGNRKLVDRRTWLKAFVIEGSRR